jgi:hypothetical protein
MAARSLLGGGGKEVRQGKTIVAYPHDWARRCG